MGSLLSFSPSTEIQNVINILTETNSIEEPINIPIVPEEFEDISINDDALKKGLECKMCHLHIAQIYNASCNHKILCYRCLKERYPNHPFFTCPIEYCNHKIKTLLF